MENNEIMNRLLEGGLAKKSQWKSESSQQSKAQEVVDKSTNQWDKVAMSKLRVTTAKYKMYIVILCILICVILFKMPNIKAAHDKVHNDYTTAKNQLTTVEWKIKAAKWEMAELQNIVANEDNIRWCLNWDSKVCDELPDTWKSCETEDCQSFTYDLSVPVSFSQLNSLHNEKMDVDEKKILKNLNEYLIKQDMWGTTKTRVGDILEINIWESEVVTKCWDHLATLWDNSIVKNCSDSFFMVPVNVTIEFSTIWDLTGFLYNVEKKMIEDKHDRILYKIQSVSYDIIASDESQTTNLDMIAYYYFDENISDEIVLDKYSYDDSAISNDNSETSKDDNNKESWDKENKYSFFKDLFS